jgi:DNA-binding transcriptional ArsR family regulator
MPSRVEAATEMVRILATPFLRALTEPARLPQDRSVVSRHLQFLEGAGIVRSAWEGRHRRYELDGAGFVKALEAMTARVRTLAGVCCPPTPSTLESLSPAGPSARGARTSKTRANAGRRRR